MAISRELGNCTKAPIELFKDLIRLCLHVQLGFCDFTGILSYKPLLRFLRERDSAKDELLIRIIFRLYLLVLWREKTPEPIPEELIQLTYSYMSDPIPETHALLLYTANYLSVILRKTALQFCNRRLRELSTHPTVRMATLLMFTCTFSKSLGQDPGPDLSIDSFAVRYLHLITLPLMSWERIVVQSCLDLDRSSVTQTPLSSTQTFENLETVYRETVAFLTLCHKAESHDHKALEALEIFIQTTDTGKILGIFACLEVAQSVVYIVEGMMRVARVLAYEFGECSRATLFKLTYMLLLSFPDYSDLIFSNMFSLKSLHNCNQYFEPRERLSSTNTSYSSHVSTEDLHDALLQVMATSCTSLIEQNIELFALAFTSTNSSCLPAILPYYWGLVPVNRRGSASSSAIRAVIIRLLVAEDTGVWIADWLQSSTNASFILGHLPLIFTQMYDKESFTLLYDALCTCYQAKPRDLECKDGTIVTGTLGYYDVFILTLSTLASGEVGALATNTLIESQSISNILRLSDWQDISLSYSSMEAALLTFSDLAYDRDVFKPTTKVTGPNGDHVFLEDAEFLPSLILHTISTLSDVSVIISCVDDGEFYRTATYMSTISCLYYSELLHAVLTDNESEIKRPVVKEVRKLIPKVFTVFKHANHLSIYCSIIKLKMTIIRLLSMASVISGFATMFVNVAPTAAVHLLLALFYSCSLLEPIYTSGKVQSLGMRQVGAYDMTDQDIASRPECTIALTSTMVYNLCINKELYYTLLSTNDAVRGSMLRIILLELDALAGIRRTDTSLLTAVYTANYRNILRNSMNLLIIDEKVVLTPWERQKIEKNLYSISYTKQSINIYDEERAKNPDVTSFAQNETCSFDGLYSESQLTAIHYVFCRHPRSQLVASMRSFINDGISFMFSLHALRHHLPALEFLLAEPVLRYSLLCAVASSFHSADSFNNSEILGLFLDSLTGILETNQKLSTHDRDTSKAAIDILSLLQDFLYFAQRNYVPDGLTLVSSLMFRIYSAVLRICTENGINAVNSQAVKLCFNIESTGFLALLPKIYSKLSSKAKPEDLIDAYDNSITSRCILFFIDIFIAMTEIFRKSSNLHRGMPEYANLSADLISRLLLSITKVATHHEGNKQMIQVIAIRALSLMDQLIQPISEASEELARSCSIQDPRQHGRNCIRISDYQRIDALPLGNLFNFIECPSIVVSEENIQTYVCYSFLELYRHFLQIFNLVSDEMQALLKAMLNTALHLQNSKRRWNSAEYFYVYLSILLTQILRAAMSKIGLLPREEADFLRATCLATNQLLDSLLCQSLSFLDSMREADGTFVEAYALQQRIIFLPFSTTCKTYITCVLTLLQRRNPSAALKYQFIETLSHVMYVLFKRLNSKTTAIHKERTDTHTAGSKSEHPIQQYILLADMLFCFITGCEGGSVFISRFFSSPINQDTNEESLELNSYGYTLLFNLLKKIPDIIIQEVSKEHPQSSKYIHRLLYISHVIVLRHVRHENMSATAKRDFAATFMQHLVESCESVLSMIRPSNSVEVQSQFLLIELLLALLNMYPSPPSAYPSSLPLEVNAFYLRLLDFVNGLATLYYSVGAGATTQNNEDGRMLLYASSLACTFMCPQLMTHAVMSKCNQCSNTLRQYLTKNKMIFGQSSVDVAMLSFICLARNCIDDRNDLKGDIYPAIMSQMSRAIFKL